MIRQNPFVKSISDWFARNFSDPSMIALVSFVVFSVIMLEFFGNILMPILISIVLAYILNSFVLMAMKLKVPRKLAIYIVYLLFLGLFLAAIFDLVPAMWRQLSSLLHEVPALSTKAQHLFADLVQKYPHFFAKIHVAYMGEVVKEHVSKLGQFGLSFFLGTIPGIVQVILYVVLVPILVFFFLKDSHEIIAYFEQFMPKNRGLLDQIWQEMHLQIGYYLRGRVIEVVIVSTIMIMVFNYFGLQYGTLLGALVGVSAIVPYVGIVVVTIPVITIAVLQWGMTAPAVYTLLSYLLVCLLDANLLVPLLFSETMSLHPLAIIVAILVFGALWGFWGVFFAIPLATFVRAVINVWPKQPKLRHR